ncbi:hypothetical protein BC940DRAFT_150614 [Gongronella butleri]|nr:hypothetical protein BC940DRAFT_150614 [Gongronella butleri]
MLVIVAFRLVATTALLIVWCKARGVAIRRIVVVSGRLTRSFARRGGEVPLLGEETWRTIGNERHGQLLAHIAGWHGVHVANLRGQTLKVMVQLLQQHGAERDAVRDTGGAKRGGKFIHKVQRVVMTTTFHGVKVLEIVRGEMVSLELALDDLARLMPGEVAVHELFTEPFHLGHRVLDAADEDLFSFQVTVDVVLVHDKLKNVEELVDRTVHWLVSHGIIVANELKHGQVAREANNVGKSACGLGTLH